MLQVAMRSNGTRINVDKPIKHVARMLWWEMMLKAEIPICCNSIQIENIKNSVNEKI